MENLEKKSIPLDPDEMTDGDVLIKVTHISVDPYQRGRMDRMKLGERIFSGAVGTVLLSKHKDFPVGSAVEGRGSRGSHGLPTHAFFPFSGGMKFDRNGSSSCASVPG